MKKLNLCDKLLKYDSLDSTNTFGAGLLKNGKPENGTVILADYQTKGKGQMNSNWESQRGENLTFTIILYHENITADKQFYLSIAVSLGIKNYLQSVIQQVKIKWPNDIYSGNKKIAGILIENFIKGDKINRSLIGVGLNVNQEIFPVFNYRATSMKLETNSNYNREQVLNKLLQSVEEQLYVFQENEFDALKKEYEANMYLRNEWADYQTESGTLKAMITGINRDGQLVAVKKDSSRLIFNFKEIIFPSDK